MPRVLAAVAALAVVGVALVALPNRAAAAGPTPVSVPFAYTGSKTTWTVPDGITQISLSMLGGEGGIGGKDFDGHTPGGYAGTVTGTMSVTPGQVLNISVGGGGAAGADYATGNGGGASGNSPLSGYAGGTGGNAGNQGDSGGGGGGGAATVITTGGSTIVAGGAGGNGGDGQWSVLAGRVAYSSFTGRADAPASSTGQNGINVVAVCSGACDGGGSGAGGGGATGGAQGGIEFGTGQYTEWFGYGGYPGANATSNISGLNSSYVYYPDNSANGSLTISYITGAPDVPTAVSGTARDGSVDLTWTAPVSTGQSALTDYAIQYALASAPSSWTTFADDVSTSTSATVTGLTDGSAYIFRVAAVSGAGTGSYSAPSASVTPVRVPAAPTGLSLTPGDGSLSVAFTPAVSGSSILDYEYLLNDGTTWVSAGATSSPVVIPGLVNGTSYSVKLRAVSAIGDGTPSPDATGSPLAVPGAPSITSISANAGSASVMFTPGFSGGGTILDYQYQLDDSGTWVSAHTTSSPLTVGGLDAGSSHSIVIRATNSAGAGAASQTSNVTLPGLPGAPSVDSVGVGDDSLVLNFTPGSTGGNPVTGYQYQLVTDGPWLDAPSLTSPIVATGLVNGTAYQVSVRAINAVGTGAASDAKSATPATTPGAPSIVGDTVAGSDSRLSAAFTAPTTDGGSAITGYEYSTDGGETWADASGTSSPIDITALSSDGETQLVNGTTYFVELRAVNAIGSGTASAVAEGIAQTVPSAPAITGVTAGPSSLTVAFTAGSNGGAAITSYQYRLDSGDWIDTGSLGGSVLIGALVNGQNYGISVRAVNEKGESVGSLPASGTPVSLPGQPQISSVSRADRSLSVAVNLTNDGGSPVTGWEYTTDNGQTWARASGLASPLVITTLSNDSSARLVNSTGYPVAVRAINAIGTSVASATMTSAPSTTPAAPTIASVTPLNQAIQVAFTLADNGGSPVSAIEYSLDNGQSWTNSGSLSSPFTVSGLDNGTAYPVQVRADNVVGNGAASESASTTPRTIPDAPTSVTAQPDSSAANVTWQAPESDGGSPITGYVASAYASSTSTTAISTCSTTSTLCSISGLTNGTGYYISVTARNVVGAGAASSPRILVTPLRRPQAPTITSIAAGNSFLTVNFSAPSDAGSSPITGYDYQLNGGAWQPAGSTSPITISSLTNGTSYSVAIRADSAAGTGVASAPSVKTPYSTPDAVDPTTVVANGQGSALVVSWGAANSNGSPITEYDAVAWSVADSGLGTQIATCTTTGATSCTFPSGKLTNGTTYYVTLQATNVAGASPRSNPRVAVTPAVLPAPATTVSGVSGDDSVALTWTPGNSGANPITSYTVSYSSNGTTYTNFGTTFGAPSGVVTGLTNGTAYTFKVVATTTSGNSAASAASAAVTPRGVGVVPTTSDLAILSGGFSFTIHNYDSSLDYVVTATSGTVHRVDDLVTISGLQPGESSIVTIVSSSSAVASATGTITAEALPAGTAPLLSDPVRTSDGYTFAITNLDANTDYTFSSTPTATVKLVDGVVTVSGLGQGVSAQVTVTASLAGHADASTTQDAAAMALGTAPTIDDVTQTVDGFTFTIGNYSDALTYGFGGTNGAQVHADGDAVTVSGLQPGDASDVTVTATLPAQSTASSVVSNSALRTGAVPAATAITRTADGYSFTIENYSSDYDYAISVDHGSYANDDGLITVSNLDPGEDATVSIAATRDGYTSTSREVAGTALLTGVAPLFSGITRTADGYEFDIVGLVSGAHYDLSIPTGHADLVGSTVTVTGLDPDATASVLVTITRDGYTPASAEQSGTALAAGTPPELSGVTRTADGYTFTIDDFDGELQYDFSATNDAVVTRSDNTVTVSGLNPGDSSEVTVNVTIPGVSTAASTVDGTALLAGDAVHLSDTTSLAHGYSFEIENYSDSYQYSFDVSDGGSAVRSGSTVTITGLGAAVVGTTVVSAHRDGYTTLTATATGSSFGGGSVPSISAITRTNDGFRFEIDNLSDDYTYAVTVDGGSVTLDGNTVTVTGLNPGQTATVHLVTSQTGQLDESADIAGRAISAGVAPVLSAARSAKAGFVFTITNYTTDFTYSFTASHGATVTHNGARVTVGGLKASGGSRVTVTASRDGYHDASATVAGSASPPPAKPAAPAPKPATPTPSATPTSTPNSGSGGSTGSGRGGSASASTPAPTATADAPIELNPGASAVTVGGSKVHSTITHSRSDIGLTSGGMMLKLSLRGKGGHSISGTTIHIVPGAKLHLSVAGFKVKTKVSVWSHSSPTLLLAPMVGANSRVTANFSLPADIAPGHHTLVVTGTSAAGKAVSLAIGFVVTSAPVKSASSSGASASTGSGPAVMGWIVGGIVLLVLIGLFFLLLGARRRRRDTRVAD